MKRPATEIDMDLSSPTGKKLCLENDQSYVPDPMDPIDDLDDADDLYGDSPAIIRQQEQNPTRSIAHSTPAPQQPSLQSQHIQLPGLGIYQSTLNGSEQISVSKPEIARTYSPQPANLSNKLQRAIPLVALSQPGVIETNGGYNTGDEINGGSSHDAEGYGTGPSIPVEPYNDQRTIGPPASSPPPSHLHPDAVTATLGSIRDSPARKEEQIGANGDGHSLWLNGSAQSHQSASVVNTVNLNGSTSTRDDLQKPILAPAHDFENQRQSIPKSAQRESGSPKSTENQISKIEERVSETSHLEPFNDPEDSFEPQQQPSELTPVLNAGGGENSAKLLEQEQSLESVQQPSGSPRSNGQPTNDIKNTTSGPNRSERSEDSEETADVVSGLVQQLLAFPEIAEQSINEADDKKLVPHPDQSQASHFPILEGVQVSREMVEANENDEEAEFEIDSSPIESSTGSDSDSSASSSGDSDYKMLDPEEEARRLMQEDGGSEDEGKGSKSASGPLRTLNEKPDEIVPKPQIEVTPAMAVAELGFVEHVVENSIVIKAKVSGERQALENGSLLCLKDRSVIGVIAETLGQVRQPYYAVRFTNQAAIAEAGISVGTSVFYVEQHAKYIFTQNLKALKGSDASNIHDEEVGDDELEFSDDEAEAEHKRRIKQARQAKRGGRVDRGDGFARGPGGSRGRRGGRPNQAADRVFEPLPERSPISYDDQNDGEDLYTPLARPTNLHEAMGHREAPQEQPIYRPNITTNSQEPRQGRPDRGRGRGERGRNGRGGRGDRRGDRRGGGGSNPDYRNGEYHQQHQQHQAFTAPPPQPINQEQTFPPYGNTYQSTPSHGWSKPYPPDQYNHPPYNGSYQLSTSSFQQLPYANHNAGQYPQPPIPQQYANANPFPYQQSSPLAPNHQYPPHQAASPTSPVPPNLPPGAHINPAFFSPRSQQPPTPPIWQQQQQQQQNTYSSSPPIGRGRSPQSEAAFLAAQEKLNLLRQLSRNGASPS